MSNCHLYTKDTFFSRDQTCSRCLSKGPTDVEFYLYHQRRSDLRAQSEIRNPQSPSTPSERDLEIYKLVKIQRVPQYEVAVDHDLHYSRVSQIVKDVHLWLIAGGQPTDPELRDHAARHRLSRAAHQLRLLRCLELATDYMEARPLQFESTRRRLIHGQEQWREETKRDPQSQSRLAAIRLVLRTTEALHKLDREGDAPAEPKSATDQDVVPAIFELLCTLRIRAQDEGRLQPNSDVNSLVAVTLNNLLGTQLDPPAISRDPRLGLSRDPRPCDGGALTDQLQGACDSQDVPLSPELAAQASAPQSGASAPLNFSAEPENTITITSDADTPCADSIAPTAKKKRKLERPTGASNHPNRNPPILHSEFCIPHSSDPPPAQPSTSYTQQPHPPPPVN